MQNLLQLAGRCDISPTNIADANINGEEEEGLDGIIVDLMDHDAFNTNEMITMTGDDKISDGEEISDSDDDNDNDKMMDAADGDGTAEGLATGVAQLSIPDLFKNFENSIEWGGYDYDYRHSTGSSDGGEQGGIMS